ncbi:SDR family oxidoreductase [Nocardioides dubius]|uniref:SDR family oxidoreductase n=1 Tax=Nocardioides dubius TaxID=317019 RepID=A0ABN1TYP4_9ACTN
MSSLLTKKAVLVTGAGNGLGRAIAELAAEEGAAVLLADVDLAAATAAAAELSRRGLVAVPCAADVSDEAQVEAMVARAVAEFGRLDAAVNNAALMPDRLPIVDLDVEAFDRIVAVNLRGVALCMKHQARQFRAQGAGEWGIVNIGSVSSVRPRMGNPAYVAVKHGVVGLTKTGAVEMAGLGVRVNAVLPGGMDTPMIRAAREAQGRSPEEGEFELSLFGRLAQPREVAEAAVWLASPRASYVTGALLAADAGYIAR